MSTSIPRHLLSLRYADYAQEYLRSLPLEHFMEATAQGTQRKITLESLDLVHAQRSDVHVFNELLVQYPLPRRRRPGQVVPDNMVVIYDGELHTDTSYDVPLQPAPPFWMLEYVSKYNKRKDYEDNFDKYEKHLKVPYYLTFYPDNQELTLHRRRGSKYISVKPNAHGRYPIVELELELTLHDRWVRFWHRGQLLPLPGELQQQLAEANRRAAEADHRAAEADRRAAEFQQQLAQRDKELARLHAQLEQLQQPGK